MVTKLVCVIMCAMLSIAQLEGTNTSAIDLKNATTPSTINFRTMEGSLYVIF